MHSAQWYHEEIMGLGASSPQTIPYYMVWIVSWLPTAGTFLCFYPLGVLRATPAPALRSQHKCFRAIRIHAQPENRSPSIVITRLQIPCYGMAFPLIQTSFKYVGCGYCRNDVAVPVYRTVRLWSYPQGLFSHSLRYRIRNPRLNSPPAQLCQG